MGCLRYGIFGMRNARACSVCGKLECWMLEKWDVGDVGCWGCGMLGCGILVMWYAGDVKYFGCGMLEMWYVRDVGYGTFAAMLDAGLQNVFHVLFCLYCYSVTINANRYMCLA